MLQEKGYTAAIIIQKHPEHGSRVYGASSLPYPLADRSALVTNPLLGWEEGCEGGRTPRGILMTVPVPNTGGSSRIRPSSIMGSLNDLCTFFIHGESNEKEGEVEVEVEVEEEEGRKEGRKTERICGLCPWEYYGFKQPPNVHGGGSGYGGGGGGGGYDSGSGSGSCVSNNYV
ncbi:hypothetical protein M0804_007375 [Polistes exclamans]|nr:hypothetical protein M0804_007375 [Polistes exclamans]